jgi:hypothetical protein
MMTIALIAWALWFGAVIALFVFVLALFRNDREIAVQAAPQLFTAFQKYHLELAAIALLSTAICWILNRSKLVLVNFILLAIAACCGIVLVTWFIGPMNALREQGLSDGEEFKRLHGQSMIFFMGQAIVLLIYGIIAPFAMRGGAGRSPGTAAGTDSPA